MTMDVTKAIEPRSDQQNADDYITGPKTVKIKSVDIKASPEQPVSIHLYGHEGKPWKPSKTALRCLAAVWGPDANAWRDLSLTLYCDPEVTWGGMKVGGIRVSHMEGLTAPRTLMLTKTRGKKGATIIKPLEVQRGNARAEPEPEPQAEVGTDAVLEAARKAARGGKADFAAWWKANPQCRPIANEIIDELKELAAEADADNGAM